MRISKTISILFFASILFIISTIIAQDKLMSVENGPAGDDAVFAGTLNPTKGQPGLPKDLQDQDDIFQAMRPDDREPASLHANSKVKAAPKKAGDWAASTTDGFEYKIRIKQQVSVVWVMKKNDRFDFIFANNNGSRVNLSIPAEQFYALKSAATDLRSPASDMSKCKDNFIQLEMVETNSRKTVATCLSAKSKQADQIRQFGDALTAYVR